MPTLVPVLIFLLVSGRARGLTAVLDPVSRDHGQDHRTNMTYYSP
jgi:hypothetical protein